MPSSLRTICATLAVVLMTLLSPVPVHSGDFETGSVVFIHPDGTGGSIWQAMRNLYYGPDSVCNWDRMGRLGLYRSHVLNSTNSSSHGGATIHSWGIKVLFDTFGITDSTVRSASGKPYSIMYEAQHAGMSTALINSGHICEPGTAVFVANSPKRSNVDLIANQVINSGVDIIMSGGERMLLPEGVEGHHGVGERKDGLNLIERAKELGYTVVYTRDELLALPDNTERVLGVFAHSHTFNAMSEERLRERDLPQYFDYAPTVSEMTEAALRILSHKGKQFLMVVEEEGTDNFGNSDNASGMLTAAKHADDAIGVTLGYIDDNPNTLLITAADSEAGGFQIRAVMQAEEMDRPLSALSDNGAPQDGVEGPGSIPYTAAPDKHGNQLHFSAVWACYDDVAGSVIARAHGLNAELLGVDVDNTDIYRVMYATLFGELLPRYVDR